MFRKSFKAKIIIPAAVIVAALALALNIFLWQRFSALSDALIEDRLAANIKGLKLYLEASASNSRAAAVSMALNPRAIKAIKERDSEELIRLFSPAALSAVYINCYTICDNRGIVLVRAHSPGDPDHAATGQDTIKDALSGKTSTYYESDPFMKVAVHTGFPVYDEDNALIGVVSAGVRFDTENTVNELKKLFDSDITVFWGNEGVVSTITGNGTGSAGMTLEPHIAEIVLKNKHEYSGDELVFGRKYKTFYEPLVNAQNDAFAAFFIGVPIAEVITAANKSIRDGIILGLAGLVISVVLLYLIISTISNPIITLSHEMDNIANGNLRVNISIKHDDEVGRLGASLQKVADILHKLLGDINIMIAEQDKGNTDFCLNPDDFQGDYKVLANSVLGLTSFGMRDHLTEIPNRRSFDNRMNWEWERAKRDKSNISVMMIDIDKFKNYNDTFGHQQGDVALKTVAKTVKQTVKRSIDFAARYGGEEFVVLLPSTGANGSAHVAEKIRLAVESVEIPCEDPAGRHVTISIGVSSNMPLHEGPSSISSFITEADDALYKAKEAGRNRVVSCGAS
ncbi:MAG: diguanylate cyclase [Treponema sp.]|nr:diguanylate cyclase [Treponema sp.]